MKSHRYSSKKATKRMTEDKFGILINLELTGNGM